MSRRIRYRKTLIFIAILAILVLWSSLLYFVDPVSLVGKLGVYNSALVIFLIAVTGGLSMFTTSSLYLAIITFAVGGVHPLVLGVVGGVGTAIGDSLFYYLGYRGRLALSSEHAGVWQQRLVRFESWLSRKSDRVVMLGIFLYSLFAIFPNDILAATLGLARYRYRNVIVPILLGNTVLLSVMGYLAAAGVAFFA